MAKYRKKPVVIDAFVWTGGVDQKEEPEWIVEAIDKGDITFIGHRAGKGKLVMGIRTLEGVMVAQPGDYVIRGVQGEIYPCKPDIFEATYEKIE